MTMAENFTMVYRQAPSPWRLFWAEVFDRALTTFATTLVVYALLVVI